MLNALAMAMSEKGYVGTTVTDVIKRAGVSRETFYEQFGSKHDCFVAAFELAGDLLLARLAPITKSGGSREERLEATLSEYLHSLVEFPEFARLFLVEAYAAGPEVMQLRTDRQRFIAHGLAELLEVDDRTGRFACELLVAGAGALVTPPLVKGDHDAVLALKSQLLDFALRQLAP